MRLHYTLLFSHSDLGWNWGIELYNRSNPDQKYLYQRAFYQYYLHTQGSEPTMLFHAQQLFQQYVYNAWAVVDQNKLDWLCHYQANIYANVFNGLKDSLLDNDTDTEYFGQQIILSSLYTSKNCYI